MYEKRVLKNHHKEVIRRPGMKLEQIRRPSLGKTSQQQRDFPSVPAIPKRPRITGETIRRAFGLKLAPGQPINHSFASPLSSDALRRAFGGRTSGGFRRG
jgi:hypothetical protein